MNKSFSTLPKNLSFQTPASQGNGLVGHDGFEPYPSNTSFPKQKQSRLYPTKLSEKPIWLRGDNALLFAEGYNFDLTAPDKFVSFSIVPTRQTRARPGSSIWITPVEEGPVVVSISLAGSSATLTGNSFKAGPAGAPRRPLAYSLREPNTWLAFTPYIRATRATEAPGASESSTIRLRSSTLRRRRGEATLNEPFSVTSDMQTSSAHAGRLYMRARPDAYCLDYQNFFENPDGYGDRARRFRETIGEKPLLRTEFTVNVCAHQSGSYRVAFAMAQRLLCERCFSGLDVYRPFMRWWQYKFATADFKRHP